VSVQYNPKASKNGFLAGLITVEKHSQELSGPQKLTIFASGDEDDTNRVAKAIIHAAVMCYRETPSLF
jgi:hypothetical protein